MSKFTPAQRAGILAEARANIRERDPAAQPKPAAARAMQLVYKTHDDARVADDNDDRATAAAASAFATAETAARDPGWRWVERHVEYRASVFMEATGEALGEIRAQAREHCENEVSALKHELKLLKREFRVLQSEVGVERGLRNLHDEVAQTRKQVPKVPALVAELEATQAQLQRELDATKKKLLRVRVNQSTTDFHVSELRKEMATAKAAASIEVEMETSTSRFRVRDLDPGAANALREFASQIVDARDGGSIWLSDPAGTAQ
jgi:hypothetical protein